MKLKSQFILLACGIVISSGSTYGADPVRLTLQRMPFGGYVSANHSECQVGSVELHQRGEWTFRAWDMTIPEFPQLNWQTEGNGIASNSFIASELLPDSNLVFTQCSARYGEPGGYSGNWSLNQITADSGLRALTGDNYSYYNYPLPRAGAMCFVDNRFFVQTYNGWRVSNGNSPDRADEVTCHIDHNAGSIVASENFLIATDGLRSLTVFDRRSLPDSLTVLMVEHESAQRKMFIYSNDYLFSVSSPTVLIERVEDDGGLTLVSQVYLPDTLRNASPVDLAIVREHLFVTVSVYGGEIWRGLLAYDISEIEHPEFVGFYCPLDITQLIVTQNEDLLVSTWSQAYLVDLSNLLGVDYKTLEPRAHHLFDAYPNPFNSTLSISFEGNRSQNSTVSIFDGSGRLQLERILAHNVNSTTWEASGVSAGTYFVHLNTANGSMVQPVVLVK